MTRKLVYTLTLMALIAMFVSVPVARADSIKLTLLPAVQTINPGETVSFYGTIENLTGATQFLNGDAWNGDPLLAFDDTAFILGSPGFLTAGGSWTGELFSLTL